MHAADSHATTVLVAHDSADFLRETASLLGDAFSVHTVGAHPASVKALATSTNVSAVVTEVGTPAGLHHDDVVDLVTSQRQSAFLLRVPTPDSLADTSVFPCLFGEPSVVAIEASRWQQDLRFVTQHAIRCPPESVRRMTLEHCIERRTTFELPNEPALIESVAADLVGLTDAWHLSPRDAFLLRSALSAAVANAIYHGNLEVHDGDRAELAARRQRERPYSGRRVQIEARVDSARARFVIRHEGPGFDSADVERNGWKAVHHLDEVHVEGNGRTVVLVKRNPGLRKAGQTSTMAATTPAATTPAAPPVAPPPPPPIPVASGRPSPAKRHKMGSDPTVLVTELGGDLGSDEIPVFSPDDLVTAEPDRTEDDPGAKATPVESPKRPSRTAARVDRDVTDLLQNAPKADPFGDD